MISVRSSSYLTVGVVPSVGSDTLTATWLFLYALTWDPALAQVFPLFSFDSFFFHEFSSLPLSYVFHLHTHYKAAMTAKNHMVVHETSTKKYGLCHPSSLNGVNRRLHNVLISHNVHFPKFSNVIRRWRNTELKDSIKGQFVRDWLDFNVTLMGALAGAKCIHWLKLTLSYFKYLYN